MRAQANLESGRFQNALDDFRQAGKLGNTSCVDEQLYEALIGLRRFQEVIDTSSRRISKHPLESGNYVWRAKALAALEKYQAANNDFISAVSRDPKDSKICLSYASFLATCPDADFRNGDKAYVLAGQACHNAMCVASDGYDIVGSMNENPDNRPQFNTKWIRKGWTDWRCLDTLAAVHAENGQFGKAVECQELAIRFAPKERKELLQSRLKLYQNHKPLRND